MKFIRKRILILCALLTFLLLSRIDAWAQGEKTLTLEDAIAIALEKSYPIKSLRLNLNQAEQNLLAAKGRFKTSAELSLDLPNWSENVSEIPVQNALPVFNTTGSLRYQSILDINQPLPTDGRFTLRGQVYHRDVSTFRPTFADNIERRDMYTSISLRFQQPLFTLNRLKLGLLNANLNYERTEKRYNRSELNIIYQVTQTFFELYRVTWQFKIAQDQVQEQEELYELAKKKYQAGLIPEVEALQMEVDLAESRNELVAATGAMERSRDALKQLIGLSLDEQITVETEFSIDDPRIDLDRATTLALQNRSEIREAEIAVQQARLAVREADARSEIRGDLYAFYDITGISDPNLPYPSSAKNLWNSSLEDMKRRPNNRGVVFTLTVPLWDWGVNRAEVAAADAESRDAALNLEEQRKTIVREVREVVGRLQEALNRLQVLRQNQQVAQRAFDISTERFNNGDITSQELALNRNRLTQAKLSYLNAYIDYKLATADLKRKTMWDWEKNKSVLN